MIPSPSLHLRRALPATLIAVVFGLGALQAADEAAAPAWAYATGGPVLSSPAHADRVIFIGSDDRRVHALDAATGTVRWTRRLASPVRCQALVDGDAVLVANGNDLACLARADGSVLWTFSPGDAQGAAPADRWDYHQASPVQAGGLVYHGAGNGVLHALDRATGAVRFTFSTDDRAAIRSRPAVEAGVVYFGDWNGVVYALDAASGALRWKHGTLSGPKPYPQFGGVVSPMHVAGGRVTFGARNPDVCCLDAATGERIWTFTAENGTWVPGTPAFDGDTMFITGSDDHRVHALDAATGKPRWSCDVGSNMFTAPLVAGRHVLVASANSYAEDAGVGRLHVIDRATGALLRSVVVGGNVGASSPLLLDGRVIIGSEDGRVLAFDLAALTD